MIKCDKININNQEDRKMKLAIGNDHAAVEMKLEIMEMLKEQGHEVVDFGCGLNEKCDYPTVGAAVGKAVACKEVDGGVLICGTGIGISMAANKIDGVRAAVCSEPVSAALTKRHNNANIIAFGARIVGVEMAKSIVNAWLNAEFEGGRHQRRIDMITQIEEEMHG